MNTLHLFTLATLSISLLHAYQPTYRGSSRHTTPPHEYKERKFIDPLQSDRNRIKEIDKEIDGLKEDLEARKGTGLIAKAKEKLKSSSDIENEIQKLKKERQTLETNIRNAERIQRLEQARKK